MRLARRGWRVTLITRPTDKGARSDWTTVPTSMGRYLPASSVLEGSVGVDVVLADGYRLAIPARMSLVDSTALRSVWARRARIAGVETRVATVRKAIKREGRVAGILMEDGTELLASLTIDTTGRGVLLDALYDAAVGRRSHPAADMETVAAVRLPADPATVQASWVGRLQLLFGLEGAGALAWRCATRDGRQVLAAATAGPGAGAEDSRRVLRQALHPLDIDDSHIQCQPITCRRPLDSIAGDGLLAFGGAAGIVDTLLGLGIPLATLAGNAVSVALDDAMHHGTPDKGTLFRASTAFHRGLGGVLAERHLLRREVFGLEAADREALVTSGALGPMGWHAALVGGGLLQGSAALQAFTGRLPAHLKRQLRLLMRRAMGIRIHHSRYPQNHDLFAFDTWQQRADMLSRPWSGER